MQINKRFLVNGQMGIVYCFLKRDNCYYGTQNNVFKTVLYQI